MKKAKVVGLDKYLKVKKKEVTEYWIVEQNRRLVKYAAEKIQEIGYKIKSYNSRNHMDRTGNLLNSLCWCVSYRGKLVGSGFFREETYSGTHLVKSGGKKGAWIGKGTNNSTDAYLHEWSNFADAFLVDGRARAEEYLKRYGVVFSEGWRVVFAILAPYWGYWEEGFTFKGKNQTKFLRFAVMTEFHDQVEKDLKPSKVKFRTEAPEYTYSRTIKSPFGSKHDAYIMGSMEKRFERWSDWKNKRKKK